MALIKQIETPYGVTAEYWNVAEKYERIRDRFLQVTLLPYIDEAARLAEKAPLQIPAVVYISGDDYAKEMTLEDIYEFVKTDPFFEGAEDALEGEDA